MSETIKLLSISIIIAVIGLIGESLTQSTSTTSAPIDWAKERDAFMEKMKNQFFTLKNMTSDFQRLFINETLKARNSTAFKDMSERVSSYFKEPAESETNEIDHMLNKFYPLGGPKKDYMDTKVKFDEFCKEHEKYFSKFRSWIRRKYIQNTMIQVTYNIMINKIDKTADTYCSSVASKQGYITNMKQLKEVNLELVKVKNKLLNAADYIKNSTEKVPKLGRMCCSFWTFGKELEEALNDSEAKEFTLEMTKTLASSTTDFLCYFYKADSDICKNMKTPPESKRQYKSLILEIALFLGEITKIS